MGKGLLQKVDVLLVQGEDPWPHPKGGVVTFARCLLRTFGCRVAVAAPTDEPIPVGTWLTRTFEGQDLAYFNLGPLGLLPGRKSFIPSRIRIYRHIRQHMDALHASGVRNLLLDSGEALFAAKWSLWDSVCYCFHGLSGPDLRSRLSWAQGFGPIYRRWLLDSLRAMGPDAVIVAAEEPVCELFCRKSRNYLNPNRVYSFPVSVDTSMEKLARDVGKVWKPLAPKPDLHRLPTSEAA